MTFRAPKHLVKVVWKVAEASGSKTHLCDNCTKQLYQRDRVLVFMTTGSENPVLCVNCGLEYQKGRS